MKISATMLLAALVAAVVIWAVLKDMDEVFFSMAIPGVGSVAAGGRFRNGRKASRLLS